MSTNIQHSFPVKVLIIYSKASNHLRQKALKTDINALIGCIGRGVAKCHAADWLLRWVGGALLQPFPPSLTHTHNAAAYSQLYRDRRRLTGAAPRWCLSTCLRRC